MKAFIATFALAAASGAFASEATQFDDVPVGTQSRAAVRAAIGAPSHVMNLGEATVFVDAPSSVVKAPAPMLVRSGGRIVGSRNHADEPSAQAGDTALAQGRR